MRESLNERNRALVNDLNELIRALSNTLVTKDLKPYRDRIVAVCENRRAKAQQNLKDLALGQKEILEDILSSTQGVMRFTRLISTRMASPILRALPDDHLSLTVINWLHQQHAATAQFPVAVGDGDCAIWTFLHLVAPIYFLPSLEQKGLLF